MAFLFRSKHRTPGDLVKSMTDSLSTLEKKKDAKSQDKALEELAKHLHQAKQTLYGEAEAEPSAEACDILHKEFCAGSLFLPIVRVLERLDFEARKNFALVFNNLLRRNTGSIRTVDHIAGQPELLELLVKGYESDGLALTCGTMLRECMKQEPLARIVLHSKNFYAFFDQNHIESPKFDVASDSFSSLKDLLTRHKVLVAEYLEKYYESVFTAYTKLLTSENYVTRRQSLKLLGELLMDRANFNVMTRYISDPENLKLMMKLMVDKSKNIQFEAFHVFKVFVANPKKSPAIQDILRKNQEKLLSYLSSFHNEKEEDEQFREEKGLVMREISGLRE